MRRLAFALTAIGALLLGGLAVSLFLGAGMLRQAAAGPLISGAFGVVVLPAFALAAAVRRGAAGNAAAAGWCGLLIVAFPIYFPGERARALDTGLAVLGWPLGVAPPISLGEDLDQALPVFSSVRPPAPDAAPLVAQAPPPEPALNPDQVELPFEGEGRSLSIPVTVEGANGVSADVWMLFDTGATLTTLDEATLRRIGVTVAPGAPVVTVQTAGGERKTRLALIDRVWVSGFEVRGVTVSVCDDCASERAVGLLGLNVSGRFLATVDHQRKVLLLQPEDGPENRALDIGHWLDLGATATRWPDGRVEVEVRVHNRASRPVDLAQVGIACDASFTASVLKIPAGGDRKATVSLPPQTRCDGYSVRLDRALW